MSDSRERKSSSKLVELDEIEGNVEDMIGGLCELGHNEKRWLQVGIYLHTVLSPALRKFLKPEMDQLFLFLDTNHALQTQTYQNHMEAFIKTYLNYEAINHNRVHGQRKQECFDYSVKNSVDLSKLFLPTNMTHYPAFDESCEFSALMRIIIRTGMCSSNAEGYFKQLYNEVHIPWTHCGFAMWDETKYTESFNIIQIMFFELGLPDYVELLRWKNIGKEFIDGKSNVMAKICKQVQYILKSVEVIAVDTPERIPRLKQQLLEAERKLLEYDCRIQELTQNTQGRESKEQESYPSAIYRMDEDSRILYKKALECGYETKREIRVLVVGRKGAGKTSLTRRLLSKPIDDVKDTNGIEIHSLISKNDSKEDSTTWHEMTQTVDSRLLTCTKQTEKETQIDHMIGCDDGSKHERSEDDFGSKHQNSEHFQSKHQSLEDFGSKNESFKQDVTKQTEQTTTYAEITTEENDDPASDFEPMNLEKQYIERRQKAATNTKYYDNHNIIGQDIQDMANAEENDEDDIRIHIWDFGGDEEFYYTHQLFLAEDAVFLIVTSLEDSAVSSDKEFCFWFNTIHCYCKDCKNNDLNPRCIVIGTKTDLFQNEDAADYVFGEKLRSVPDKLRKHIFGKGYLISNKQSDDKTINNIKRAIINAGKKGKEWETKHPMRFILLDKALEKKRHKLGRRPVLTRIDIQRINEGLHQPLTEDELELYLRYNTVAGHLIYYEDIPDYIVIDPQWLSDLFRCIVTADKFRPSELPRHDLIKLRSTGQITETFLKEVFKLREVKSEFQSYLLKIMEKFHIVIQISHLTGDKANVYFAPCMVKDKSFDVTKTAKDRSTWLCLECDFLPPFLFNHIIISFCEKYFCLNAFPMFYSEGAVLVISPNRCEKLAILKLNNVIQLQIMIYGKTERQEFSEIKSFLSKKMAELTQNYYMTIMYEYKWKCPESPHNSSVLMDLNACRDGDEYYCETCSDEGRVHTFKNYWDKSMKIIDLDTPVCKGSGESRSSTGKKAALHNSVCDFTFDHILKLFNNYLKDNMCDADNLKCILDYIDMNPSSAEIILALALCERKSDVADAIIDRFKVESINMAAVFSYVSRNGDSQSVKAMMVNYNHELFDLNTAIYSASLSCKYENVRIILENLDTVESRIDFEYVIDCLAVVNGLKNEIIDIILKYSAEYMKEILIEKSLEHSPYMFRRVMKEYTPANKTNFYVLLKACSQENLENVVWLFKKAFKRLATSLVFKSITVSLVSGQFHVANFLIRSHEQNHLLDQDMMEMIEILIYRMWHDYFLKLHQEADQSTVRLNPLFKYETFLYDENVISKLHQTFPLQAGCIDSVLANLNPSRVLTCQTAEKHTKDYICQGWKRVDWTFDGMFIDILIDQRLENGCHIEQESDYRRQGWKRVDWTFCGMFIDILIDQRLETGRQMQTIEQESGFKDSGKASQAISRINHIDYLLYCKKMKDSGISNAKFAELLRNAVLQGNEMCCRFLISNSIRNISNRDLELNIYRSIFYFEFSSDAHNSECYLGAARALLWELTCRFYQLHVNRVNFVMLYPAIKCYCQTNKLCQVKLCSYNFVLVAEVDKFYPDFDRYFGSVEVKHVYGFKNDRILNNLTRCGDLLLRKIDQSICVDHGVSFNVAKDLLSIHSNLVSVVPSILKSKDADIYSHKILVQKCITFVCHLKGFIPFGEKHFNKGDLDFPIDVVQGTFKLTSQVLQVGDRIESAQMAGTLGGFLSYYNRDCFLTCAHVVMDYPSLISRTAYLQGKDLCFYIRDQNNQRLVCGSLIRHDFDQGSESQPGIDAAIVECDKNNIELKGDQYVKDQAGNNQTFQFLGLKSGYLNDNQNIIDYELLTLTEAKVPTMAFSSQIQIVNNATQFYVQKDPIEIVLNSPGPTLTNVNGVTYSAIMIASPSHFQHTANQQNFRMYKQMYLNIPLSSGDSGTCIYIKNIPGHNPQTTKGNLYGCLGMAIAFLNGMSVVTPMKDIKQKLL